MCVCVCVCVCLHFHFHRDSFFFSIRHHCACDTGLVPTTERRYRAQQMALWLDLIPRLHRAPDLGPANFGPDRGCYHQLDEANRDSTFELRKNSSSWLSIAKSIESIAGDCLSPEGFVSASVKSADVPLRNCSLSQPRSRSRNFGLNSGLEVNMSLSTGLEAKTSVLR